MNGKVLISPGFTAILTWQSLSPDETLPALQKGDTVNVKEAKLAERQTIPPDYLMESELITLMEKHGIGTDASIPVHINNVCQRNYVQVGNGRKLIPTQLGIVLVHGYLKIDPELVLPTMRSEVETQLNLIARGQADFHLVKDHMLEIFRLKFIYFVQSITGMDMLFKVPLMVLRVDVEPNCEGTTGTAWNFLLSYPSPCSKSSDTNNVILMNDKIEVQNGGTANITDEPHMPNLIAYYCGTGYSVQWTLDIGPSAKLNTPKATYLCQKITYQGVGVEWNIYDVFNGNIIGGPATLSWVDSKNNKGSIEFTIYGNNPSTNNVISLITQSTPLWYAKYIAEQESDYQQFKAGIPYRAKDNGFGIFQLTNTPAPTCVECWNWKENVAAGVSKLKLDNTHAVGYMNLQRKHALLQGGGPVPTHQDGNCIFQENTAVVIDDAVAMKQYNGAGPCCGGQYCVWNGTKECWHFNEYNDPKSGTPWDYVNQVCSHVPLMLVDG